MRDKCYVLQLILFHDYDNVIVFLYCFHKFHRGKWMVKVFMLINEFIVNYAPLVFLCFSTHLYLRDGEIS